MDLQEEKLCFSKPSWQNLMYYITKLYLSLLPYLLYCLILLFYTLLYMKITFCKIQYISIIMEKFWWHSVGLILLLRVLKCDCEMVSQTYRHTNIGNEKRCASHNGYC